MNRVAAQDIQDRGGIENAINLYHSQGTIIGDSAMELYAKTFQQGVDLEGNLLRNQEGTLAGPQTINNTQVFKAVGPAESRSDWISAVTGLTGLTEKINTSWIHDPLDPILYLTAPSNLITDVSGLFTNRPINSPVYIPNVLTNIPLGIWNAIFHMENHDVKNPMYSGEAYKDLNQSQKLSDPLMQNAQQFVPQPNLEIK
jgi:hypothetical protein